MKSLKNKNIVLIILFLFQMIMHANDGTKIPEGTFSSGGGMSSNNKFKLQSIVGQTFIGTSYGKNIISHSGFLYKKNINVPTGIDENSTVIPSNYELSQNFPNPFNPVTNIRFSLPKESKVTLKIYNILGEEVSTLFDQFMNAGTYTVLFQADNLTSGVYLYNLTAEGFSEVRKMILIK